MRNRWVIRAIAAAILGASVVPVLVAHVLGDFETEALPAFRALLHGDLTSFVATAPVYGGSLLPRAPFVWVADAFGAGGLGLYKAAALPCLLAVGALAVWLERRMARAGRPLLERAALVGVCLAAAPVLDLLDAGHPEEALAAALCVAAVLVAMGDRPVLTALALGAALAVKPWAVVAVGPVLLAAPRARVAVALGAFATAAAMYLPLLAVNSGQVVDGAHGVATTNGWIFKPQQIWWPLRTEQGFVDGISGFAGPAWVRAWSHPLVVAMALAISAAAGWRRFQLLRGRIAGSVEPRDALLLLAAVGLARCLFDPWNSAYYVLPCVLALAAWEALGPRGLPALSAGVLALTWVSFIGLRDFVSWDGLAAGYLVWAVPALVALTARACLVRVRPPHWLRLPQTKATTGIEPL
jgi:hypothetical protein